jgi:fatty acid synthase subunit alpha
MRPEVEQDLAHTLLVELLAYQFASPVRWIETQDVILGEKTTERIVEIGPADTLGGMAKRTLAAKYEAYDAARSVQRQILCYNKDAKDIYYDVDPVEDEPASAPAASSSVAAPAASSSTPAPAAAVAAPPPSAGPAAAVADAPVGAVDILRALVAQKLKKSLQDIPLSKAIKDLVGGKNVLPIVFMGIERLTTHHQANPHCKMKFWEIWGRSSAPRLRSQKTHRLMNSVPRCRPLSTVNSVNNRPPSSPEWSLRKCPEASTSQRFASIWKHGGASAQVDKMVCCSLV